MLTLAQVFDLVPQRAPFRFLDRLLEVDEKHAVGEYTYRHDEFFYCGDRPGASVTPGAILAETMGQTANALLVYQLGLELSYEEIEALGGGGTDVSIEYARVVLSGETVRARAERMYWRARRFKSRVELSLVDGTLVAHGTIAGMVSGTRSSTWSSDPGAAAHVSSGSRPTGGAKDA
jgi:3-hydroxyacyl-[acyl-carrier-protein] dehydratase